MNEKMRQAPHCTGQCKKSFRWMGQLAILLALLICGSGQMFAQLATADILGTVTDSTGAIVPKANVTLVNLGTRDQRVAISNDSGSFQFTLLPVGHYSVTVKAASFKTTTTSLAVEAGDRARADIHLEAGGTSETVVVEAQTPLLQADNATVSSTVTSKAVQDLPLNGRNFVQLVQLVPGANEGPGNGLTSGGRPDDRRSTNGFSVNGQDDILNNYVVDGIDDNERVIGTIGVKPSVEDIEEITVQTNSYAPEAGRTAGGVINLVTKSGTNKFHGTLYEYLRNDKLDARNFFFSTALGKKPELRQNQFGGSIGGPIIRNKTFFFGDYEGQRVVKGVNNPYSPAVPSTTEYNAINAATTASTIGQVFPALFAGAMNCPGTTVLCSVNGIPITQLVDKVALNYLQLYPAPNNTAHNTFVSSPNQTQFSHTADVRVDQTFSQNDHFFARYNYNKVSGVIPPYLPAGANPKSAFQSIVPGGNYWGYTGPATDKAQQVAFGYTHLFSQNLVADLRAAYTRVNNFSQPQNYNTNADTAIGLPANGSLTTALTPMDINGLNSLGDGAYVPLQDIDNTYQYSGTVSYTIGNHNLKLGAGVIRRQARNVQSAFPFGDFSFGLPTDAVTQVGAQTYNTQDEVLASTLAGAFSASSYNVDYGAGGVVNTPDYRTWEPSFFIQDNWKITPSLTVNYGIRYDVYTPFTEAHNKISNFDFNSAVAATTQAGANAALQVAGVNGVSATAGIRTEYTDFAPRFGFSYSIWPGTVLRGGYGISYFPGNYTANADLKNAPFTSVYSPNCVSDLGQAFYVNSGSTASHHTACSAQSDYIAPVTAGQTTNYQTTFNGGLPVPLGQTISSSSLSFFAEDPKLKTSMIQQFNLQFEQQFGPNVLTIGYVGNIGQHLPELLNDINVPTPAQVYASRNDASNYDAPRPLGQGYTGVGGQTLTGNNLLPNIGQIKWLASGGVSNYNGLQAAFQRRFVNGLAFDANYTWGHALSDVVGFSEEGHQGWGDADPTHIRQIEYGNAENDIRNRFALSINYTLPLKNFKGVEKVALGGWQVNSIIAWQSGKPFSITNASSGFNVNSNWASPNHNGGPDRPNQIGDPFKAGAITGSYTGCTAPSKVKGGGGGYWFNPCAFNTQTEGTVGSTARNSIYGPHFRHVDLSLFKDFPIYDTLKLQFRAEAFNITNTPSFYLNNNINYPDGTRLGDSNFGQISETDPNYTPRQLQFALKLQF